MEQGSTKVNESQRKSTKVQESGRRRRVGRSMNTQVSCNEETSERGEMSIEQLLLGSQEELRGEAETTHPPNSIVHCCKF